MDSIVILIGSHNGFIFNPSQRMLGGMSEKFQTKKSLGQHFLNSAVVPRWLCDAAKVEKEDLVVEIGPGTGVLTKEILERGAKVVALETDRRAIEVLNKDFAKEISSGQLEVSQVDVRKVDISSLGLPNHGFKVVANIPYYLTGHLFRVFLENEIQPSSLVFLVQKEVARRATAELERGEKESLLSLSIKAFGNPTYIRTVGKGHFVPMPKIDSAIVLVENISREHLEEVEVKAFFKILRLGFGQKRKQLLGNLSTEYGRARVEKSLESVDLNKDVRAEDVALDKWIRLVKQLERD